MSAELLRRLEQALSGSGENPERVARSLSTDELTARLEDADDALRGRAEADAGKITQGPGPSLFPGMTDAKVIRRFRDAERRERLEQEGPPPEPPLLRCTDCGTDTPHLGDGATCEMCFDVEVAESSVAHWQSHLDCNLDEVARGRVEGEMREAKAKLRDAKARQASYRSRGNGKGSRGQEDRTQDGGSGLLGSLGGS
jgi:hypothetical protein